MSFGEGERRVADRANGRGSSTHPSRLDWFDAVLLLGFALLAIWLVVVLLAKQGPNHSWTGAAGLFFGDQAQYLGWIQESSRHLLVANPFQVSAGPADFLHPGLVLSGVLVRLGASPPVAYLLWVPVAVVAVFAAVRAYVNRLLSGKARRRCALVLALFYLSPVSALLSWLNWPHLASLFFVQPVVTEMWPGLYLWGYPFTALAVAAVAGGLLVYERDRRRGRVGIWCVALALLASWLQPWQGVTLVAVIALCEAMAWARRERVAGRLLVATTAAGVVPLVYFAALSHFDPSWANAGRVNLQFTPAWQAVVAAIVPLGLPSLLAYRTGIDPSRRERCASGRSSAWGSS